MSTLDNPKTYKVLDPENMLGAIADFPDQVEKAWLDISKFPLPTPYIKVKNVVILGMGSSGVAAEIAYNLALKSSSVPLVIVRDYDLPDFVDGTTLVIAVSYSGNTEETVIAFKKAEQKGAKLFAASTGGDLGALSRKYQTPHFQIDYGAEPRAALGYLFSSVVGVMEKLGFMTIEKDEVKEAVLLAKSLQNKIKPESPAAQNYAKQLALKIVGRTPIIFAPENLSGVARRWKGQLNENSKNAAYFEIIPECNHNALMGLKFPKDLYSKIIAIFPQSKYQHPRNKLRQRINLELLTKENIAYESVLMPAVSSPLSEILQLLLFGDYLSYYLALLNRVNPTLADNVKILKEKLMLYGES